METGKGEGGGGTRTDSRYAKAAERASGEERQSITAEIAATADAAAGSAAISTTPAKWGAILPAAAGGRER